MPDDKNLELLRELSKRAAPDGTIELHSSEIPFALWGDGRKWLAQAESATHRFRLTDHGRAVLR